MGALPTQGRTRRRSTAAAFAAASVVAASLWVAPAAQAGTTCGGWAPSAGEVRATASRPGSFNVVTIRVNFRFTPEEIQALRCTGSSAFEVDVNNLDLGLRGGLKSWKSNLPGSYLDTEGFDDADERVLTVGSQTLSSIEADVDYYTEITLTEVDTSLASRTNIVLNFQRGSWASLVKPVEAAACARGARSDPAWCVFADETVKMLDRGLDRVRLDLNRGYATTEARAWGTSRRTALSAGQMLYPGERIESPGGAVELVMQNDGNLVEVVAGRPVWASGTGQPGSVVLMQGDGNVVVVAPGNKPVWSTGTAGGPGSALLLQDDRNLVVYAPGNRPVWANGAVNA